MASNASQITPEYALHPYQRQVLNDLLTTLAPPRTTPSAPKAVAHMPTGAGKTRVACAAACYLLNRPQSEDKKVVIWLASTEELCAQAAEDLSRAWRVLGNRPVAMQRYWGDYSADLDNLNEGFLVAGLAKLWHASNRRVGFTRDIADIAAAVIFDEAHQAIARTYKYLAEQLAAYGAPLLGLTATPGRTAAKDDADYELAELFAFNKVTIDPKGHSNPVEYLIKQGFLADPEFRKIAVANSGLSIRTPTEGADYLAADLRTIGDNAVWQAAIVNVARQALRRHKRVIVFCPSVRSAQIGAAAIRDGGHSAVDIVAATPSDERRHAIEAFKRNDGAPMAIFNYGVLTAGFDAPKTRCVIVARPTTSLVLYSQMIGRAMRGPRSGGNRSCEIYTVVDTALPGFGSVAEAFENWEELWQQK